MGRAVARDQARTARLFRPSHPRHGRRPSTLRAPRPACALPIRQCSQQGQRIRSAPKALAAEGFAVVEPPGVEFCCGSAEACNLLRPERSQQLKPGKAASFEAISPGMAAGNIGCMIQIVRTPASDVHSMELLDWASGGLALADERFTVFRIAQRQGARRGGGLETPCPHSYLKPCRRADAAPTDLLARKGSKPLYRL